MRGCTGRSKEEVALELSRLFDLADVATVRGGLVVVEGSLQAPNNGIELPIATL